MTITSDKSKCFWEDVPFFGSRFEQTVFDRWYLLLLPLALILAAWGVATPNSGSSSSYETITAVSRDPFIVTFGVGLALAGIAFTSWQRKVRQTFSRAVQLGIVSTSSEDLTSYLSLSQKFEGEARSNLRFIPITLLIGIVLVVNIHQIPWAIANYRYGWHEIALCRVLMMMFIAIVGYGGGALIWALLSVARWIARFSASNILRIQPGHSDACCGLEDIGNCCLRSSVPMLIGMALCLVWANATHFPWFSNSGSREFIGLMQFVSYPIMVALFVVACSLVFLPIRNLHLRLEEYKQLSEQQYTTALEAEIANVKNALLSNDDNLVKAASDRLKLAVALDTTTLKIATWPFDRVSLIRYGITPIVSLAGSFGKDALKAFHP